MGIQYYLYVTWPLFFSFWLRYPSFWPQSGIYVFSVFSVLHYIYGYAFDNSALATLEFAVLKPILVMGSACLIGSALGQAIDVPAAVFSCFEWHVIRGLILSLIWIGCGLLWQLGPQVAWLYWIVVVIHILVLSASYWCMDHDGAWGLPGTGNSRIVHFHFFVVAIVIVDLCFAIGQSISHSFPHVYLAIISLLVAITYTLLFNIQLSSLPRRMFFSPVQDLPIDYDDKPTTAAVPIVVTL